MTNYFQRYRNAISNFEGDDEDAFDKEMQQLFVEALEAGDRRMAMELQDCIITATENGAPVNVIIADFQLLSKTFPDIAAKTLEILKDIEA